MKHIKHFLLLVVFLISFGSYSQVYQTVDIDTYNEDNNQGKYFKDIDNDFAAFTGTWEFQQGNTIFRVTLWKNAHEPYLGEPNAPKYYMDEIRGHFEMVQLGGGDPGDPFESVIYTSDKKIGNSQQDWYPIINISTADGMNAWGLVLDNVVFDPDGWYNLNLLGTLSFEIIPGTDPVQAHWKVAYRTGMSPFSDLPTEFTIPTDIILIKQ